MSGLQRSLRLYTLLFPRCQWQVEANGVISPALTPSPSPLPLTIDEDREFTYPSDVLVPPVGHYFDLPRIRLPPGIMIKLREISGRARPQFRPSIRYVTAVLFSSASFTSWLDFAVIYTSSLVKCLCLNLRKSPKALTWIGPSHQILEAELGGPL